MMGRLLKKIDFASESYAIIKGNRWLLLFPLLNLVINLAVLTLCLMPLLRNVS